MQGSNNISINIKEKIKELTILSEKIDADEIYSMISSYKYVSFDIFDTLVKRNVKTPADIFRIMELSIGDNFTVKRINAEQIARKNAVTEEITLNDIYKEFPDERELKSLELHTELAAIIPNISILKVYRKCVEAGKTIFITTDMYWPLEAIQELLHKIGVDEYDEIYLSSDRQKTKRTGSLFKELLLEQSIMPADLIHIGDHPKSDYKVPKNLGIATVKLPICVRGIQFKYKMADIQDNYLNSLIKNTYPGSMGAYYEFGYSQFGKLLWGYSEWIYKKVRDKEINDLFFLARDGWIMKQAYDICVNDSSIHTHYLEVSRRSLRVPILWMDFNYEKILNMVVNAKLVSIRSIFDGLGLELDDYSNVLESVNIGKEEIFDRNTIKDDKRLKTLILSLKESIICNSKKEYEALKEYLKANGVRGKFGIVDIGYAGSMQMYLQMILNTMGVEHQVTGFYLAVTNNYKKNDSVEYPLDMYGYLFDFKHDGQAVNTVSSFVGVLETLFLEQDGSVKRFVKNNNQVLVERYPYEYFRNGKLTEDYEKIKALQNGALDFVKVAALDKNLSQFEYTAKDLFYGIYETGVNPDKHDLDLFSEIEFYDEGITKKLAEPRSLIYYISHVGQLKNDFLSCRWKIGFMKKLFKVKLPYQKIYLWMKRNESKELWNKAEKYN